MSLPQPPRLEQNSSAQCKGNIGITPFEKQLCEETAKATREQCMVEIKEQTRDLNQQKEQFWAKKATVAELERKYEVSEAERKGLKAENDALKEHNKELLALNKSLLEKLYGELDEFKLLEQGADYKEGGRIQSYAIHP
ncbi:hypothetical protein N7G274_004072 [Stereocaulon virgatum]|uniref:Uncharacterized protein n=1 Tax=Stereocaulon virgatum TaxID=373712 RepID=A0ABR4AC13_9LECA